MRRWHPLASVRFRYRRRLSPWLGRVAEVFDPSTRWSRPPRQRGTMDVAVVCVYRSGNAAVVDRLLAGLPQEAHIRLWALDRVVEHLEAHTIGCGSGPRSALLNRLVASVPASDDRWVVVTDDDLDFRNGDIGALAAWSEQAHFDVAQPAHVALSAISHRITRRRLGTVAREVGFVEIGPVVAVSPRARSEVFPLPEADGMGLGTEALWCALPERGLRLGIVDVVRVEHHGRGRRRVYDQGPGIRLLHRRMARFGGLDVARVTHSSWRWPRRTAPWEGAPPKVLRSAPADPSAR